MRTLAIAAALLLTGCSVVHTPRNYYLLMDN
jgi:uncharacterized lipoprotein YmbA